jgi:hypothetical protein
VAKLEVQFLFISPPLVVRTSKENQQTFLSISPNLTVHFRIMSRMFLYKIYLFYEVINLFVIDRANAP